MSLDEEKMEFNKENTIIILLILLILIIPFLIIYGVVYFINYKFGIINLLIFFICVVFYKYFFQLTDNIDTDDEVDEDDDEDYDIQG